MIFLSYFNYLPIPKKPNTFVLFKLVNLSKSKFFLPSLSLFISQVWSKLLFQYPNQILWLQFLIIFYFGFLIDYKKPDTFISSGNLPSILIQLKVINQIIASDLVLSRIMIRDSPINHFISSPLSFVLKYNGHFKKIYHLSYSHGSLVNNFIASKAFTLSYSLLQNVFDHILVIRKHTVLIKQDIKNVFCNIPIAPHIS